MMMMKRLKGFEGRFYDKRKFKAGFPSSEKKGCDYE
jgi:hypothetical protein